MYSVQIPLASHFWNVFTNQFSIETDFIISVCVFVIKVISSQSLATLNKLRRMRKDDVLFCNSFL